MKTGIHSSIPEGHSQAQVFPPTLPATFLLLQSRRVGLPLWRRGQFVCTALYQSLRWGCQPEGQGISKGSESSDLIKTPYRKYTWLESIAARTGRGDGTCACIGKGSLSAFAQLLAPIYHINTQTTLCLLEWEMGAKHFITTNWKISGPAAVRAEKTQLCCCLA